MRITPSMSGAESTPRRGNLRQEMQAAIAETVGLFLIFIVAITGRDHFGDGVKTFLIVLTIIVGGLGAVGGVLFLRRGAGVAEGRMMRLALSSWMIFAGGYSIVHVLS